MNTFEQIHQRSADRGRYGLADAPNYTARRAGALALTALAAGGAIGIGNFAADRMSEVMRGPNVPALVEGDAHTRVVTVEPGDTAWEIADQHTDGDPRALVDAIMDQPAAQDGLQGGDRLVVPEQE